MKQEKCTKCGCKIPKDEKIAISNCNQICQSCWFKRNHKPGSIPFWYKNWIEKGS